MKLNTMRSTGRIRRFGLFKYAVVILLSAFALSMVSSPAHGATTSDPNHKGWTGKYPKLKTVVWKPISSKCDKCIKITEQYNQTVQELLNSRYWVHFWREAKKLREKGKADPLWPGKGDISDFEGKAVAANLELFELQSAQLELHRTAILMLEQQAQYLSQAIKDCERTACPNDKPAKQKQIKIGGEKTDSVYQPDTTAILKSYGIAWHGPYKTDCLPCRPIVVQLNAGTGLGGTCPYAAATC